MKTDGAFHGHVRFPFNWGKTAPVTRILTITDASDFLSKDSLQIANIHQKVHQICISLFSDQRTYRRTQLLLDADFGSAHYYLIIRMDEPKCATWILRKKSSLRLDG